MYGINIYQASNLPDQTLCAIFNGSGKEMQCEMVPCRATQEPVLSKHIRQPISINDSSLGNLGMTSTRNH